MIYTIEYDFGSGYCPLEVELFFHPYFDGGRDEPSEPAWVQVGDIHNADGDEVSDQLGNDAIRDIVDHVQMLHPDG